MAELSSRAIAHVLRHANPELARLGAASSRQLGSVAHGSASLDSDGDIEAPELRRAMEAVTLP